jgi:hypothetical protein
MRRGRLRLRLGVVLGAVVASTAACFQPKQPACVFDCALDHKCPPSYTCGSDGMCHRDDDAGVCLLGGVDGGAD